MIDISEMCEVGKLGEKLKSGYRIVNLRIGEDEMKDMRGIDIKKGDRIVYGKSDRNRPIKLGVVTRVENNKIYVLGDGNKKEGEIGWYCESRVLVLPESYHSEESEVK